MKKWRDHGRNAIEKRRKATNSHVPFGRMGNFPVHQTGVIIPPVELGESDGRKTQGKHERAWDTRISIVAGGVYSDRRFSLEKSQPSCQKVYLDKLMPPVELGA